MAPIPTQPAAADLIDTDLLAELFETLGPERGLDMLSKFMTATDAEVPGIVARIKGGTTPLQDSQREVHKLAGSAAIFGAKALGAALRSMETACKAGDAAALAAAAEGLAQIWAQSRAALVAHHATEIAKG